MAWVYKTRIWVDLIKEPWVWDFMLGKSNEVCWVITQTQPAFTLNDRLLTREEMFLIVNHPRNKTSAILFLFISISFSLLNVSHISQDLWIQIACHKGLYGMFLYLSIFFFFFNSICSPRDLGTQSIFFL